MQKSARSCTYPAIVYAEGAQNTPGIQLDAPLFDASRPAPTPFPPPRPERGAYLFLDGWTRRFFSERNAQISVIFMRPVKVSCGPFRVWKNAQKRAIII